MTPRISLDDAAPEGGAIISGPPFDLQPSTGNRQLAVTDWDRTSADHLLLYLAEEPGIGDRFSYNGIQWQVVDYCDGWVARILL